MHPLQDSILVSYSQEQVDEGQSVGSCAEASCTIHQPHLTTPVHLYSEVQFKGIQSVGSYTVESCSIQQPHLTTSVQLGSGERIEDAQLVGSYAVESCSIQQPYLTTPVQLGSEERVEDAQLVGFYPVEPCSIQQPHLTKPVRLDSEERVSDVQSEERVSDVQSVGSCSVVPIQWPLLWKPVHRSYDSTGSNCSSSKSADSVLVHEATSPTQVQHDWQQYSTLSTEQVTSIKTSVQCSSPADELYCLVTKTCVILPPLESRISRPHPIGV